MTNPGQPEWMSLQELAAATGLPAAYITQFVPATNTFEGPRYDPHQVALARVVRRLTSESAPEGAIHAAIADLSRRPYVDALAAAGSPPQAAPTQTKSNKVGLGIGAVAALLVAGLIGGFIGSAVQQPSAATHPQVLAAIPTTPDSVCAEWAVLNDNFLSKRAEWSKTDPTIPATQWTEKQRSLTTAVIPTIQANADELSGLADKATNPVLKMTLQMQVLYMNQFAQRLPNYTPEDRRLWQASTDFGNATNSLCYAMAPK